MEITIKGKQHEVAEIIKNLSGKTTPLQSEASLLVEGIKTLDKYSHIIGSGRLTPLACTAKLGFYGEVPAADFITGADLCEEIDLTAGELQHSDTPWLKFAINSQTMFVAKKPIRNNVSFNSIDEAGAVSGESVVEIDGEDYTVTLLSSKEWNQTICMVHEDFGFWGEYTDADLLTHYSSGKGSFCWTSTPSGAARVDRGGGGVSGSDDVSPGFALSSLGFRPVLRAL